MVSKKTLTILVAIAIVLSIISIAIIIQDLNREPIQTIQTIQTPEITEDTNEGQIRIIVNPQTNPPKP